VLELHVPNEPRAARWLGSAGLGYAKAATRFSGEGVARLRLYVELSGDIARVLGRHTDSGVVNVPASAPPAAGQGDRSRPARRRSLPTNAAERVDQILSRATPSAGMPALDPWARGPVRPSSLAPAPAKPKIHESGTRSALPGGPSRTRRSAS
jgi:hypothetical protein